MKISVVKHRIMHIGLSLFLSKFYVVVDIFYWLNKGSLSCKRYIIENVVIGYSSSQKAN